MADNITTPGAGTVLAADDVGGVMYPLAKTAFGGNGAAEMVADDNPLPVFDAATVAAIGKVASYKRIVALTPGTSAIAERPDGLYIPTAGTVTLKFGASGATVALPVPDSASPAWSPTHLTAVSNGVTVFACYLTAA